MPLLAIVHTPEYGVGEVDSDLRLVSLFVSRRVHVWAIGGGQTSMYRGL